MKTLLLVLVLSSVAIAKDKYNNECPRGRCVFAEARKLHKHRVKVMEKMNEEIKVLLDDDKVNRRSMWAQLARKYKVPRHLYPGMRKWVHKRIMIESYRKAKRDSKEQG